MGKFQSFNVAPGVDPMGIGVPDYGRSSFDPVEFVRRTWDEAQAKKMMRDEGARQKYQSMLEGMPTPEAFEQATVTQLNKEGSEISNRVYEAYQKGGFDPLKASPETDKEISDLNRQMSEYKNKIDLYKFAKDSYIKEWNRSRDLGKQGKIDEELTQQNFQKFMDEPDIYKKMAILTENPLTVMKPEPVDVMSEFQKAINLFSPGLSKTITYESFDPTTGALRIESLEGVPKEDVDQVMSKAWGVFSEPVKNEWRRRYESAPESEKVNKDGIKLDVEDWFRAKYSPLYAERMNVQRKGGRESGLTFNWNNVLPQKNKQTGQYDLSGLKGVKTYATEATPSGMQKLNYNAEAVIPLNNVFGTKEMMLQNTPNTINTTTGQKEDETMALRNIPYELAIHPVATQKTEFVDKDGKKWTFEKGERIPADIQRQMDEINRQEQKPKYLYAHETFLNSQTYYRQKTETGETAMILSKYGKNPEDIASYIVTTTRPWKEALNALKSEAITRKIDLQPLINWVDEVEGQLNFDYKKLRGEKAPQEYEDIFK